MTQTNKERAEKLRSDARSIRLGTKKGPFRFSEKYLDELDARQQRARALEIEANLIDPHARYIYSPPPPLVVKRSLIKALLFIERMCEAGPREAVERKELAAPPQNDTSRHLNTQEQADYLYRDSATRVAIKKHKQRQAS
ncbi:hypothetical protein LX59_03024 [Azomonas agilis]|uniref:Uncharacterized protein n=1 Tax=Azomonas agilis TaxID=116849 RepID=A0A562HYL7_9GAMM|nr:hypothetical protein [Azomonas agilis]TWH63860.1 hypothetical protein LX59_03024 [Azomonas agilis]